MISYNPSSARVDRDRVRQSNLQMREMTALDYRLPRYVGFFPRGTHEIALVAQPAGRCCASVWKRSLCSAPVKTHKYQSLHQAQPLVPHALPLGPAYKPEKVRRECLVILWTSVGPGYSRFMRQGCTDGASRGKDAGAARVELRGVRIGQQRLGLDVVVREFRRSASGAAKTPCGGETRLGALPDQAALEFSCETRVQG